MIFAKYILATKTQLDIIQTQTNIIPFTDAFREVYQPTFDIKPSIIVLWESYLEASGLEYAKERPANILENTQEIAVNTLKDIVLGAVHFRKAFRLLLTTDCFLDIFIT